jgi:3',5'-cyclic-AMP phosphodiesterase
MASAPFLLLQISDTHLGATWEGHDPEAALRRAVEAILALPDRPDALLVSGDLTDDGSPAGYARVRELLEPLGLRPHVLPGNHDLRGPMRAAFGLPGAAEAPIDYAVDLGPLRLVCIDTIIPGSDGGTLDAERLEWLDAALAAEPAQPTVLAMHHPPLQTEIPTFERIGLAAEAREALAVVLDRHPQVLRIVAGHVHRAVVGELSGRAVLAVPSTYLQVELDFTAPKLQMRPEPPGFALHAFRDGALASHLQRIFG